MAGDDYGGFTAAELAAVGLEIRIDAEDGWNEYIVDGVQAIVPSAPLCEVWDWMPYEDDGKFAERLMQLGLNHPERAERVFGPGWRFGKWEFDETTFLGTDSVWMSPDMEHPRGTGGSLTPEAVAAITRAPEILRAWKAVEAKVGA
jgi:hypothetical protein